MVDKGVARVRLVDLREIVNDAVGATSQIFKSRDVDVEARLPARVSLVRADRDVDAAGGEGR